MRSISGSQSRIIFSSIIIMACASCSISKNSHVPLTEALPSTALAAEPAYPPFYGPARKPTAPLRINGACPGECCGYGEWSTTEKTVVYAAALDTEHVLAELPSATNIVGLDGFVYLSRLGSAQATREVRADWDGEAQKHLTIPVNAQVIVLDVFGEGFWRIWYDGRIHQLPVDDSREQATQSENDPARGLALVQAPTSQWWARVQLPLDGRIGWILMDEAPLIKGVDGCGG